MNDHPFDLVVTRKIAAAPDILFRCWTEPALLKQWFTPKPWTTPVVETDVRVGGSSLVTMAGPDGQGHTTRGVYLEIVPNRRIVTTDAYTSAWVPAESAFMTAIIRFDPDGAGGTDYEARCRHWTKEAYDQHEAMGFHTGWGLATDQLAALAATL